ncbi:MAG: hypothetical protein UR26_C0001G0201 [candidate division TM6 bacterium GW2011_GWF2_32_72]|nr:MAG: hypothetical protein UR26_C0001G0201 [candidate division TM6 bacterium GW2011_GWF2_32_72]
MNFVKINALFLFLFSWATEIVSSSPLEKESLKRYVQPIINLVEQEVLHDVLQATKQGNEKFLVYFDPSKKEWLFLINYNLEVLPSAPDKMLIDSVVNIKNHNNIETSKDNLKIYACTYKIHLMPKNKKDIPIIVEKLLSDQEFLELFTHMKIWTPKFKTFPAKDDKGNVLPIMVIYPKAVGRKGLKSMGELKPADFVECKENAQKCLNRVYELTTEIEGMNIVPRYNFNIAENGLVYAAQGNADTKNRLNAKKLDIELGDVFDAHKNYAYLNEKIYDVKIVEPGAFELSKPALSTNSKTNIEPALELDWIDEKLPELRKQLMELEKRFK